MLNKLLNIIIIISILSIIGCGTENEIYMGESSQSLFRPTGLDDWPDECKEMWEQLLQEEKQAKDDYNDKIDEAKKRKKQTDKETKEALDEAEQAYDELLNKESRTEEDWDELKRLKEKMKKLRGKFDENESDCEDECSEAEDELNDELDRINKAAQELAEECNESASTTTGHNADVDNNEDPNDSNPRDGSPPTLYGEEIDIEPLSGYEVFINIGGVAGSSIEDQVTTSLVRGYNRLGFHVNLITGAMSWDPIQRKMNKIAFDYIKNDVELKYVVFHHGGHGWDDVIKYETTRKVQIGNSPYYRYVLHRGTPTPHTQIFNALGDTFSKSDPQFPETHFGVILDACGQGNALDLSVAGRHGITATASPAVNSNTSEDDCFVGTYYYSLYFAELLQSVGDQQFLKSAALRAAHDGANIRVQSVDAKMGKGMVKHY